MQLHGNFLQPKEAVSYESNSTPYSGTEKQIKTAMHKIQANITEKSGICFILCLKKNLIIAKVIFCKWQNAAIMAAKAI